MTRQDQFKQELFALLRKYDVEMQVAEHVFLEDNTSNYSTTVAGVNFSSYAKWDDDGNMIADTINLTLDTWENGKED